MQYSSFNNSCAKSDFDHIAAVKTANRYHIRIGSATKLNTLTVNFKISDRTLLLSLGSQYPTLSTGLDENALLHSTRRRSLRKPATPAAAILLTGPWVRPANKTSSRLFAGEGISLETLTNFELSTHIDTSGDLILVPESKARGSLLDNDKLVIATLGDDVDWISATVPKWKVGNS